MSIKPKEKPCKGIDVAKGLGFGKHTKHRKKGLGLMCGCWADFLLNTDAGKIILHKSIPKAKSKFEKEEKKKSYQKKKQQKDKLENWYARLQDKINIIVRLIDKGLPCIATKRIPNQMHAGHVFSRGSNPTIRFNLHNIHRQSAQSNHFQNDDGLLREGVVREYGMPYMEFISNLRRTPALKYSNEEYHEFYKKALSIINRMKKEDRIYGIEERLSLRDELNKELGIYDLEYCVFCPDTAI